jgi:tetratricopeptide (TPR) repeat protein
MQRKWGTLSALLLVLQVTSSPSFADDKDTCVNAAGDERIAACSRVIAAGRGNLAWAYHYRGFAYQTKGDHDRAIADYDAAIRLDPKNALPYFNRGFAYQTKGDNDRAIADYDAAIRLDPKYAPPSFDRPSPHGHGTACVSHLLHPSVPKITAGGSHVQ